MEKEDAGGTPAVPGRASPAIEVENLVVRYGAATAVDRVSFVVNAGEQLTLLGPPWR